VSQSSPWPTVTIHPSQQPDQIEDQVARALKSRRLPAKLHYLTPQQARRWLEVHAAYAPSGAIAGATAGAYGRVFDDLAQRINGRPVQVVSLGCGGGQKDARLLRALDTACCPARYLAVDAGLSLVLIASDAVASAVPACLIRRLVADLDALDDWRDHLERGGERDELQLFCAFGITPNSDADLLIERIARQTVPGDLLLISANIHDPDDPKHCLRAILKQYDNPQTRRWLTTFFADLDWPVTPGQLVFGLHEQESPARISATLTLPRPQATTIGTDTFEVPAGECLQVFFSNRFRPGDLTALLHRHGFSCYHYTETANAAEAVWSAQRISESSR
jgi:uncharacterized SAM-dependent methyltransferase